MVSPESAPYPESTADNLLDYFILFCYHSAFVRVSSLTIVSHNMHRLTFSMDNHHLKNEDKGNFHEKKRADVDFCMLCFIDLHSGCVGSSGSGHWADKVL